MTAGADYPKREYPATPAVPTLAGMTTTTTAEAQAVGAVLFRAHDAARHLENLLELEAPDPRVAALMQDAKRLRKSIGALLVEVAIDACQVRVP